MARRSTKQKSIDLKMYRHFAIGTVAITIAMGVFADGESRKAIVESAAQAAESAERPELSGIKLHQPKQSEHSSNYADPSSGTSYSSTASTSSALRTTGTPSWVEKLKHFGMTLAQFQALSKGEQAALLKVLNGPKPPIDEEAAIRRASAASLEAAGGGEGADM